MAEITIQEAAEFANRAKERRLAGVTLGAPSPEKVAEVERLKAEIAAEKAIQAEEIARINRPRYIAPNDGIGVTVPIAKVVWDATKAPEGFRLIKGGARVVKDSKGNPQLIMGKTAKENDRGAPKPDCAHVFWCSATWELGELRNLPVSKAFLAAREVVANGGMAAVESRMAHIKGSKGCHLTDCKGYILPTAEQGRLFRSPRNASEDSDECSWLVLYDDGIPRQIRRPVPTNDKVLASQAQDILLNGGFQNRTPMVAMLDGQSFTRAAILAAMPAPERDEWIRKHPTAMHHTKTKPGWVAKCSQTRVTFSHG